MSDVIEEVDSDLNGAMNLFGRRDILTAEESVTRDNVVRVLNSALAVHNQNSYEIDYLHKYMRGNQPILLRKKKVRPEICNKIVENHAAEISTFTAGYFLGEPITYVRRGDNEIASDEVNKLNNWMYLADKSTHDKDLATWMSICGVGYRMILPSQDEDCPFEMDTPDPRTTFCAYNSGFGHRKLMGVREIFFDEGNGFVRTVYSVYTKTHYFEIENGVITKEQRHILGDIPIYQYKLNAAMLGSFEPAIPLLNAINNILSNSCDGVEQFIQSFLKFKNCDIETDTVKNLRELGAIVIKSQQGVDADVDLISQELNQTQTGALIDRLYAQVRVICGVPTVASDNKSSSDSGESVLLRNGWQNCETRAKDTELLFKRSERQFLRMVLRLCTDVSLQLSEIECKFTRRQHDNLLVKTQALQNMLVSGIKPEIAIATCGLFNDPMDVAKQSEDFLQKWEYRDPLEVMEEEAEIAEKHSTQNAGNPAESTNKPSMANADHSGGESQ